MLRIFATGSFITPPTTVPKMAAVEISGAEEKPA
jgi:hypothetical protein